MSDREEFHFRQNKKLNWTLVSGGLKFNCLNARLKQKSFYAENNQPYQTYRFYVVFQKETNNNVETEKTWLDIV